uniref:Uncharacterized protein n=1 Tax=viral metagenome TaxID=1070528 RepID=A0A6C0KS12_9ZZZZ
MYEKVAILVNVCGRNLTCTKLDETPFYKIFLPFFQTSKEEQYEYKIFVGIDDNDCFFLPFVDEMKQNSLLHIVLLQDCNHKPARAWNILFETAYKDGYEYFFQIGDDVAMITSNWTSRFINTLEKNANFGVTGPCDEMIFKWRSERGLHQVIENAFVHRTHYDIFGTLFHTDINNQFCDDWITLVYDKFAMINLNVKSENTVRNARYNLEKVDKIKEYIDKGKEKIEKYRSNIKVVDCFLFHNEYDLLELRLEELYDVINYFVIVEANITHSGLKKDWNFERNKGRYEKYLSKIIYIQCDDLEQKHSWDIENAHRNAISRCFHLFEDKDIILISDIDEIPKRVYVEQIRIPRLPIRFIMDFYNYNFNCRVLPDWKTGTIAASKITFKHNQPQSFRLMQNLPYIEHAGWHFSWFGDEEYCKEKIKSFAHQELNNDSILDKFKDRMKNYEDYYAESGRKWRFNHIFLQSSLPQCINRLPCLLKYIDNPQKNFYFCTYGDSNFKKSRERIISEAKSSAVFKESILYTEDSLSEDFKKDFHYLLSHKRGGGYWCWKFFLFLDILEKTKEGDWITYADAGCKVVDENKNTFYDLVSDMIIQNKVISAFSCKKYLEKTFTKGDIFHFFLCNENSSILDTGILLGGVLTFINCKETKNFFKECYNIAKDHPFFLDDSPSIFPNCKEFLENRHDQSLFSVMRKLRPDIVYTTEDKTWKGDFFIQAERIRE